MIALIEECKKEGNTLGGIFEVVVLGLPPGLGSHTQWDRKLDGRLAQALMSIQAMKGVEIGLGFEMARRRGSQVHDEIFFDPTKDGHAKARRESCPRGFIGVATIPAAPKAA